MSHGTPEQELCPVRTQPGDGPWRPMSTRSWTIRGHCGPGADRVRRVTRMAVRHSEEHRMPLWLEDIEVGSRYRTADHEITSAEIVEFASRFDPQPFHLGEDGAAGTIFGSLAASGWHTAAITMRLLVTSGIPIATGIIGTSIELAWPTPTRPGDVVHVDLTVTEVVPSR